MSERTLVHVCAFDAHCWRMWWQIAAPMRIHIGGRHWDIPVLTAIANWRTPRIWDLDNPVPREGDSQHRHTSWEDVKATRPDRASRPLDDSSQET